MVNKDDIEMVLRMAARYAMGRQTIASSSLPYILSELITEHELSDQFKRGLIKDLEQHLDDYGCFGDPEIDHPIWIRFLNSLKYSLSLKPAN